MKWVTRAQWRAAVGSRNANSVPIDVYGVALHWSGGTVGKDPHTACAQRVRGIQRFHMQSRGYADIGYSFLVCQHGHVFVGRGTAAGPASQGTNDGNLHYWSICWLAGPRDALSEPAKGAIRDLRLYLVQRGTGLSVRPHSYFVATSCPGVLLSAFSVSVHQKQP